MSDPLIKRICDSVLYNLKTIQAGSTISTPSGTYTYKHTLADVADPPKDYENFKEFPGVNINTGREVCENSRGGITQMYNQNRQILELNFPLLISVFCVVPEKDTIRTYTQEVLSDLQALIGNNYQLIGEDGAPTCFSSVYLESEYFVLDCKRPNCALEAVFQVWYRQRREDPTEII